MILNPPTLTTNITFGMSHEHNIFVPICACSCCFSHYATWLVAIFIFVPSRWATFITHRLERQARQAWCDFSFSCVKSKFSFCISALYLWPHGGDKSRVATASTSRKKRRRALKLKRFQYLFIRPLTSNQSALRRRQCSLMEAMRSSLRQ